MVRADSRLLSSFGWVDQPTWVNDPSGRSKGDCSSMIFFVEAMISSIGQGS